jgi:hypothetical protein
VHRREFFKASLVGAAALVIPLGVSRDAIAKLFIGSPKKVDVDKLGEIALRLLHNDLRGKVTPYVLNKSTKPSERKMVSFNYGEDEAKLPLKDFIAKILEPAVSALGDAIKKDAKRGKVAFGRFEPLMNDGGSVFDGELNKVRIRFIRQYDVYNFSTVCRIDVLYQT